MQNHLSLEISFKFGIKHIFLIETVQNINQHSLGEKWFQQIGEKSITD